jgi:regulatory protein
VAVARRSGGRKPRDCHERALGLLAVRPRSHRELERRLLQARFDPNEVREVLERLEGVGLIDDEAFARSLAEHAIASRKEAPRAVARRLALAGIERTTAAEALDQVGGDEEERAEALATERMSRLRGLEPSVAYRRLSGLLVRRGYGREVAGRVARRVLGAEEFQD